MGEMKTESGYRGFPLVRTLGAPLAFHGSFPSHRKIAPFFWGGGCPVTAVWLQHPQEGGLKRFSESMAWKRGRAVLRVCNPCD